MGGRTMPIECDHGVIIDWGDFGPDPNDGMVGLTLCEACFEEQTLAGSKVHADLTTFIEEASSLSPEDARRLAERIIAWFEDADEEIA